jgi:hypothetical protein
VRSEIRNIRFVHKGGAFGNTEAFGTWIYGKRPDGRTVACKQDVEADGTVTIWSSPAKDVFTEYRTEFTEEEWMLIFRARHSERQSVCNRILDSRRSKK